MSKKYILRVRRPFASFRGTIRNEDGLDKNGNPTKSAAKTYQFDHQGRLEADDETIKDLKFFIDRGQIVLIKKTDVDDSIDIQAMKKDDLIAELKRLGYNEIDGKPVEKQLKDVLLAYLEEIYLHKAQAKTEEPDEE